MYTEKSSPVSRIQSRIPAGHPQVTIADNRIRAASQKTLVRTLQKAERPGLPACGRNDLRLTSGGEKTIQRLCGFEAELPVPTLAKNGLDGFLEGGMEYATELGKNDLFKMVTDHGAFQDVHRSIVNAVNKENEKTGKIPPPFKNISNLEYVTEPVDEFAADSNQKFMGQFEAIVQHAQALFSFVTTRMGAIPETSCFTGLPVAELREMLASQADPLLTAYVALIKPEFYIQATVGIIPSSLGDLWKKEKDEEFKLPDLREYTRNLVDKLVTESWFQEGELDFSKVETSTETPPDLVKDLPEETYNALIGLLYMIASYVAGRILYQQASLQNSTTKNLVPFMLKTGWEQLEVPILSDSLIIDIAAYFSSKLKDDNSDFFVGASTPNVFNFVWDVLKGKENILTLASPHSSRLFSKPDELPEEIGQPGIQVEYRHIKANPAIKELPTVLMKIVEDVRRMNTQYRLSKQPSAPSAK